MRAVSLFSGAGGFEIGFNRAGIQTVLQAENDSWCLSVLERHWPSVERVTDVRQVDQAALQRRRGDMVSVGANSDADRLGTTRGRRIDTSSVDLVYGGFPCQDVSVAGQRAGLGGARSGLWSEFARVLSELRPLWFCAENVPGLLSSTEGRDFGQILSDVDELGYGVAWAILDARWFGIPQRRRRVFIVGCLGNADAAAQVLAICESGCRHPAPSRDAGQGVAGNADAGVAFTLPASSRGTGDGHGNAWNSNYIAASLSAGRHPGGNMPGRHHEDDVNLVVGTLGSHHGNTRADQAWTGQLVSQPEARALTARASGYRMDGETENFIVAGAQRASDGHHGHSSPRGDGADNLIAFQPNSSRTDEEWRVNQSPPIKKGSGGMGAVPPAVAGGMGVRRLTPLECERLMGWPDEHTKYTVDNREIPDSHRYRLCGNGVVSTVAEWIGHRLVAVNRMLKAAA